MTIQWADDTPEAQARRDKWAKDVRDAKDRVDGLEDDLDNAKQNKIHLVHQWNDAVEADDIEGQRRIKKELRESKNDIAMLSMELASAQGLYNGIATARDPLPEYVDRRLKAVGLREFFVAKAEASA